MPKSFFENLMGKLTSAVSDKADSQSEIGSLRKILDELDHLPPEQGRYLSAFAFILFRVAQADSHISPEESQAIESLLQEWGELTESQALLVAQIAKSQNLLFGGTDNFLVTREFRDMATPEQKEQLLNCLFAVAASDDSISSIESDTIRVISKELGLEHHDFINVRRKFIDKLEALK